MIAFGILIIMGIFYLGIVFNTGIAKDSFKSDINQSQSVTVQPATAPVVNTPNTNNNVNNNNTTSPVNNINVTIIGVGSNEPNRKPLTRTPIPARGKTIRRLTPECPQLTAFYHAKPPQTKGALQ